MSRFLLLLLSVFALATSMASAQVRRGTGLLTHNHGPVMFYARTVTLTVKPENREQFFQATKSLQTQSAHENGCLTYHYYEDPTTRNNFLLVSEWSSAETMNSYYRQHYVTGYFEQLAHWLVAPATVHVYETVKHQVTAIQVKS